MVTLNVLSFISIFSREYEVLWIVTNTIWKHIGDPVVHLVFVLRRTNNVTYWRPSCIFSVYLFIYASNWVLNVNINNLDWKNKIFKLGLIFLVLKSQQWLNNIYKPTFDLYIILIIEFWYSGWVFDIGFYIVTYCF